MKRLLTGVVAVALIAIGGVTPAFAEAPEPDVLEQILDDTAPARLEGDDVVARTGDVTAVLPADVEQPVTLSTPGGQEVSVTLPSDGGTTATKRVGDGAVEHELGDGSSIIPAVRSNGVLQVMSVTSDAAAPTTFTYEVAAGDGGSLVAQPDGGASVLDRDGQEAATVAPPWALDADGRSVPTHYEIDGDRLTQVIDTAAAAKVTYPVVADPGVSVTYYRYDVIDVRRTMNWTNRGVQLAICKVHNGAARGKCAMSASYEVESAIDATLGASKSGIGATIGVHESRTVKGSVSWTSPSAPAGSSYKAWAVGTLVTYKIQKWVGRKTLGMRYPVWTLEATSRTLSAFDPRVGFAVGQ
ncbi:hypothetical protein [Microbacterium sp. NPDC086615]|uniref:hypothetical protein n=1 Tax=Microbacterium sp. NPDC086615 TaxID=3154865 RepID=UPI003444BB15